MTWKRQKWSLGISGMSGCAENARDASRKRQKWGLVVETALVVTNPVNARIMARDASATWRNDK